MPNAFLYSFIRFPILGCSAVSVSPPKIYLRDLTWREFNDLCLNATPCIAIQPTGSIEQHGLHLPLGTDAYIAEKLAYISALEAWRKGFRVLVSDSLSFGVSEMWLGNPGTVSIRFDSYVSFVSDLVLSLIETGFKYVVVLNGHAGNSDILKVALRRVSGSIDPSRRLYLVNWWEFIGDVIDRVFSSGFYHADEVETSIAYALGLDVRKDLVRSEESRRKYSDKWHPLKQTVRPKVYFYSNEAHRYTVGAFGDPGKGDGDKGRILIESFKARFMDFLEDILNNKI